MPDSTNASASTKSRELVAFERVDATIRSENIQTKLGDMLPPGISLDRFTQIAMSTVRASDDLMRCASQNFDSMILAIYDVAKTGLMPDKVLGQVYIVPFKGKAQMILGYRGMITLAMNSGAVTEIYANLVHAKDDFEVVEGTSRGITHRPDYSLTTEDRGAVVAVYAVAQLTSGATMFEVMSFDEIERIRSLAPSANSPAWKNHWGEMARKTAVRRLCKYLPQDVQKFTQMEEHFDATGEVVHLGEGDYAEVDETTAHDPETGEVIEPDAPKKKSRGGRPKGSRNKPKATKAVVEGQAAEPEQTDLEDAVAEAGQSDQAQPEEPQEPDDTVDQGTGSAEAEAPAEEAQPEEPKPTPRTRRSRTKILEGTAAPEVVLKDGKPNTEKFMDDVDNQLNKLTTKDQLVAFWKNIEPLLDQMDEHDPEMKPDVRKWFDELAEKLPGDAPF